MMEACDGRDALQKITEFQPDLILSDLVMPVMNGFEMVRTLRDDKDLRHLKVVSVSASSFLAPEIIRNEYHFDDTLEKPVLLEKLFQIIQNQLDIEWIYDTEAANLGENTEYLSDVIPFESTELPESPDIQALTVLYQLTQDGNFIALHEYLNKLTSYPLFVKKLRILANNYQDKEIYKFLYQCQQKKLIHYQSECTTDKRG